MCCSKGGDREGPKNYKPGPNDSACPGAPGTETLGPESRASPRMGPSSGVVTSKVRDFRCVYSCNFACSPVLRLLLSRQTLLTTPGPAPSLPGSSGAPTDHVLWQVSWEVSSSDPGEDSLLRQLTQAGVVWTSPY